MIKHKIILFALTTALFSTSSLAEVPVIDDSENYALLEEQRTSIQPSSAFQEQSTEDLKQEGQQQALAHDNTEVSANDNLDAHEKIKGLRQEVQELRGQIEVLAHDLKQLKEQQLTFYKDLDARIQNKPNINLSENTEAKSPDANQDPGMQHPIQASEEKVTEYAALKTRENESHSSPNTSPADEQISYLQAYELVKSKQFPEAITAMQKFVTKYPNGFYTANAQYWLGEIYLAEKNYSDAISHFDVVLQQYPASNKYSASLLKIGYALAGNGRYGEAKEKLREVMQRYPDTNTSNLAKNKLEEINSSI